jgi:hypothetical protein
MYTLMIAYTIIVILIAIWISRSIDRRENGSIQGEVSMPNRLATGLTGPLFEGMSGYANRKRIATNLWNGQNVWAITPVGPQYFFVSEKSAGKVVLSNNEYLATAIVDPNYFSAEVALRLGVRPMAWRVQSLQKLNGQGSPFDHYTDEAQLANLTFLDEESIFGLDDQMDANRFYCFMFDGFGRNWDYYMEVPIIVGTAPDPEPLPEPVIVQPEPVVETSPVVIQPEEPVIVQPEPLPDPIEETVPKDGEFGPMVEDPTPARPWIDPEPTPEPQETPDIITESPSNEE